MKKTNQLTIGVVSALVLMLGASPGWAETITFGSNNDGLGGFTQSTTNAYNHWTDPIPVDSVGYTESTTATDLNGALNNNSLLKTFTLDRSVGNAYRVSGTMSWSAEADRNNRQGLYLFGDYADVNGVGALGQKETGALALIYNVEDGQIKINEGLDSAILTTGDIANLNAPAQDAYLTGAQLAYEATVQFVDNGGVDQIDVTFTMFNNFGGIAGSDTISTTVNAVDYTGDYFGFAGRTRSDGGGDSIANYQSFEIATIPEPATLGLVAIMGGALFVIRRRFMI